MTVLTQVGPSPRSVRGVEVVASRTFPAVLVMSGIHAAIAGHLMIQAGWEPVAMWLLIPAVAVLDMLGALVHEGGHVLAARLQGLRWTRIRLTPIGIAVSISDTPSTPFTPRRSLVVALGGPVLGLVLTLALAWGVWHTHGTQLGTILSVACLLSLLVNTLNLLPVPGLDGGRAAGAVLAGLRSGTRRLGAFLHLRQV